MYLGGRTFQAEGIIAACVAGSVSNKNVSIPTSEQTRRGIIGKEKHSKSGIDREDFYSP